MSLSPSAVIPETGTSPVMALMWSVGVPAASPSGLMFFGWLQCAFYWTFLIKPRSFNQIHDLCNVVMAFIFSVISFHTSTFGGAALFWVSLCITSISTFLKNAYFFPQFHFIRIGCKVRLLWKSLICWLFAEGCFFMSHSVDRKYPVVHIAFSLVFPCIHSFFVKPGVFC